MPSAAADAFAALPDDERARLRPEPLPERVSLMKAVLTDERFSDPDWIYERKLDGIRCAAIRRLGGVRLLSRNDLSLNGRFPEVAAALEADADTRRRPRRRGRRVRRRADELRAPAAARRAPASRVFYYVFDLLHLAGQDVTALALRARKSLLRHARDVRAARSG